jgi:hypothetical protein
MDGAHVQRPPIVGLAKMPCMRLQLWRRMAVISALSTQVPTVQRLQGNFQDFSLTHDNQSSADHRIASWPTGARVGRRTRLNAFVRLRGCLAMGLRTSGFRCAKAGSW